jgi:hypothetical protein
MKEPPAILVCALADAKWTNPGTIYDRKCADCGRHVMIAPSGQKRLLKDPDIVITCACCFMKHITPDTSFDFAAESLEELRREFDTTVPNLRRYRN